MFWIHNFVYCFKMLGLSNTLRKYVYFPNIDSDGLMLYAYVNIILSYYETIG